MARHTRAMFSFFQQLFPDPAEPYNISRDAQLKIATATLLIEVMQADNQTDDREQATLEQQLKQYFELNERELKDLLSQALKQADQLVSLQHLTRLMNEELSATEKLDVIRMMWRISFADGDKDRFEEHLIRQVAELLYIPHSQFIQARLEVEPQ